MKHIGSYMQALIFAVLFMRYISGSIGWAMIYVLAGGVTLSIVSLALSRKHVSLRLENLSGISQRGGETRLRLTAEKTGFCFLPFIDVYLELPDGETLCVRTALTFGKTASFEFSAQNLRSGIGTVRIKEVYAQDFFQALRVKLSAQSELSYPVLPQVTEYGGPDVPVKTLPSDEDDAEEGRSVMSGGLPGYEHREYAPGDSLRRINYKLSAKCGRLMVRLDEETGVAPVTIAVEGGPSLGADTGETVLSLARRITIRGGRVNVCCGSESFSASSAQTVDRLREWLAFRDFSENAPPVPAETAAAADVVVSGGLVTVRQV